jgi:hypothetical protein
MSHYILLIFGKAETTTTANSLQGNLEAQKRRGDQQPPKKDH